MESEIPLPPPPLLSSAHESTREKPAELLSFTGQLADDWTCLNALKWNFIFDQTNFWSKQSRFTESFGSSHSVKAMTGLKKTTFWTNSVILDSCTTQSVIGFTAEYLLNLNLFLILLFSAIIATRNGALLESYDNSLFGERRCTFFVQNYLSSSVITWRISLSLTV